MLRPLFPMVNFLHEQEKERATKESKYSECMSCSVARISYLPYGMAAPFVAIHAIDQMIQRR